MFSQVSVFGLILSRDRVTIDGVWIIDHLQILITSNYNSLTELCTPNVTVTTAHIKSSVFISHLLIMDLNTTLCLCPYRLAHIPQLNWALNFISLNTPQHEPTENTDLLLLHACMLGFPHDCYTASLLANWLLSSNSCCLIVLWSLPSSRSVHHNI
jgi:hypothetical protein